MVTRLKSTILFSGFCIRCLSRFCACLGPCYRSLRYFRKLLRRTLRKCMSRIKFAGGIVLVLVGENMTEIRPPLALAQNCQFWPRCDSSKVAIQEIVSGNFRKAAKLNNRKSLVIEVVENLTEIRPPLALAQKWRFFKKWDSSEVMFRKIVPTSDNVIT